MVPVETCSGCDRLSHSVRRLKPIYDSILFTYERVHCNAIIGGLARPNQCLQYFTFDYEMLCGLNEGAV